jgi:hypothetical protein
MSDQQPSTVMPNIEVIKINETSEIVRSRPLSANSGPPSRPKSAKLTLSQSKEMIDEVEAQLRRMNRQIKRLQREKAIADSIKAALAASLPPEDPRKKKKVEETVEAKPAEDTIDPLLDLQEHKEKLIHKWEGLTGQTYMLNPVHQVQDFLEIFYQEFSYEPRSPFWIIKYYDPEATWNIVGYKAFERREKIVAALLVRKMPPKFFPILIFK